MSDQVFDLRKIRNRVAGRVTIADGSEHDVIQLQSVQYQDLRSGQGDIFSIARMSIPTLPVGYVMFTEEANAIISIATSGVSAVENMFPNGNGPENDSTSPG